MTQRLWRAVWTAAFNNTRSLIDTSASSRGPKKGPTELAPKLKSWPLFSWSATVEELTVEDEDGRHQPITSEEVKAGVKRLKSGKSCGDDGLYAEMLKTNHAGLIDAIARIFTDILGGSAQVPETWCVSRLVLL